jgi:hypothetical protein
MINERFSPSTQTNIATIFSLQKKTQGYHFLPQVSDPKKIVVQCSLKIRSLARFQRKKKKEKKGKVRMTE